MTAPSEIKEKLLRLCLTANFLFSGTSGIALLAAPSVITVFLGEAVPHWLMLALGAGLLLFAAGLLRQILRRPLSRGEALLTILMDDTWVLASILLLVLAPDWFSAAGQWLIGGVAAAVAAIALAQWIGLRRLDGATRKSIRFKFRRSIAASCEQVWPVIADHEGYADVADNLSRVEVVAGQGLGMARRCYDNKGRGWNETCVLWDEGRTYSFEVDTSDYPFPLREVRGTWGVEPADGGSVITMTFDIVAQYGAPGRLVMGLALRLMFSSLCERLLDKWQARIMAAEKPNLRRLDAA
jgi:hypothetical protein